MRYPPVFLTFSAWCLLAHSFLAADTVILKDGGAIEGCRVVRESSSLVFVRTPMGRMNVPRKLVARIKKGSTVFHDYDAKKKQLNEDSATELYKLALWCKPTPGLRREMNALLKKAIALEPNHIEARHLLGYARLDNKWKRLDRLEIRFRCKGEEDFEILRRQLTILLGDRDDMRLVDGRKQPKSTTVKGPLSRCELSAEVTTRVYPAPRFYGLYLREPVLGATIGFRVSDKWISGVPAEIVFEGEVPRTTPNERQMAVTDACLRNYKKLHDLLDRIGILRVRTVERLAVVSNREKR